MLNRYHRLYDRLQSSTTTDLVSRLQRYFWKRIHKKQIGWTPSITLASWPATLFYPPIDTFPTIFFPLQQKLFEHVIHYNYPIDWHLDISANKRFPLTYAPEITLRDADLVSAGYVWELNRLSFLPTLAMRYRITDDPGELNRLITTLSSWIRANPYLLGINWISNLDVSIRLINWFVCWNILDASVLVKTSPVFQAFVESTWLPAIYQHCLYCRQHLSFYTAAIHQRIAGYAGLFIASSFWPFPESSAWQAFARNGLEREMMHQQRFKNLTRHTTADYLQLTTDAFLIAYRTGQQTRNPFSSVYTQELQNLFQYLAHLLSEQGLAPHFGDEGSGRLWNVDDHTPFTNAQSLLTSGAILFGNPVFKQQSHGFDLKNSLLFGIEGQQRFAAIPETESGLNSHFYPEEGHFILRKRESKSSEIYVHFNATSLHHPAAALHGHADALSFTLHIDGQPFFVDSGTYCPADNSEWRRYFVGTRAHNTVCLDQQDQALLDPNLRWLKPYSITVQKAESRDQTDEVVASHNGYRRIGCWHQRRMIFDKPRNWLSIEDRVVNKRRDTHTVEVLFHAHPDIRFRAKGPHHFVLSHPQTKRLVNLQIDTSLRVEVVNGQTYPTILGWYSPRLYQKKATCVFRAYLTLGPQQKVELKHQIMVQS
ncbi:alginate lyase family protein [Larkinella harenae]